MKALFGICLYVSLSLIPHSLAILSLHLANTKSVTAPLRGLRSIVRAKPMYPPPFDTSSSAVYFYRLHGPHHFSSSIDRIQLPSEEHARERLIERTRLSSDISLIVDVNVGTPVLLYTHVGNCGERRAEPLHHEAKTLHLFILADGAAIPPFNQSFGLAINDFDVEFLMYEPADGVLGFSALPSTPSGDPTLIGNLFFTGQYFNASSKVATLWVNKSFIYEDMEASLMLGGSDETLCSSEQWVHTPHATRQDWGIAVNAIRIEKMRKEHKKPNEKRTIAVIPLTGENRTLTANPLTLTTWGPVEAISLILASIGCDQQGFVPCEDVHKLNASVIFELDPPTGGRMGSLVLTPHDYITKIGPPYWNFGVSVLQKYCVQMDYGNRRVGFTPSRTYEQ